MTNWVYFQGPGFTMNIPSEWLITATPSIQVMFVGPNTGRPLRSNMAITISGVQPDVTADSVAETAKGQQLKDYPEFNVVEERTVDTTGIYGFYRLYTWHNPVSDTHVVQSQTFFVIEQLLYSLTSTTSVEDEPLIAPFFAEMFATFQFVLEEPAQSGSDRA